MHAPDIDMDQLLSDLEALPWTGRLEARSVQVVSERFGVSPDDAELIVDRLRALGTIQAVADADKQPESERPTDAKALRWKVARAGAAA